MYFFAEDRELAWLTLAAGCPDYRLCLWKWLEVSLHNVVNQQNMENLTNRWWSKVTGPYSIGIGFTLWILTVGESLTIQNWALLRQDGPRLRRRLGFQIWGQASMSSFICRCSNPSDQRASSSKNRSHMSQIRRNPRGFSSFLSRSLDCLLPWLKASRSLGLD